MSTFLPPNGKGQYAIGVCDRCNSKVQYSELRPDGNSPGLMVCNDEGCWDTKDPWRLPPRKTEDITLKHPRPDYPVAVSTADALADEADILDDNL